MRNGYVRQSLALAGIATVLGCAPGAASDGEAESNAERPVVSTTTALTGANPWNWVDVAGSVCGDGSPTGFGISYGDSGSSDLVILLEGGGGCWDETSCNVGGTGIAANIHTGYGSTDLQSADSYLKGITVFDRTNGPYPHATQVYVPYCTGDFHAGNATQTWSDGRVMHYAGRTNLEQDLAKVVALVPNPSRITLAGMSAGAIGGELYYWRVRQLFGNKRVDLIADSAPFGYLAAGRVAWHASEAFPPGCAACSNDYRQLYPYYASAYPDARFAFLAFYWDPLMQSAPAIDSQHYITTEDLEWQVVRPLANNRFFAPYGSVADHTMLGRSLDIAAGAETLGQFLSAMATDSPAWNDKNWNGVACPAASGNATGAAEAKFIALGACASVLGAPTSSELTPPDQLGRYVQFQYGSIYWYPSTGAHEVHGAIRDRWGALGWERSALGYPATDEMDAAVAGVRKNVFQTGVIFKTPTAVRTVSGAIYSRYSSLGAEGGALGLPIGDQTATGVFNLDRVQQFTKGRIYWSAAGGTSVWYN
jgi:hypothetical protein